jgi:hypothetical protein
MTSFPSSREVTASVETLLRSPETDLELQKSRAISASDTVVLFGTGGDKCW